MSGEEIKEEDTGIFDLLGCERSFEVARGAVDIEIKSGDVPERELVGVLHGCEVRI